MLSPRHALALFACCASVSSAAVAPCTTTETAQLDALAATLGGLLRVCKTDSGFDLYPFKGFPPSDKATIVCNGRGCPSVLYSLEQATLPECTVDIEGKPMTPREYLTALCPANGPAPTATATPTPTTPAPSGATTTPTTTSPTTTAPTTTPPTTTTATPVPTKEESKTDGSSSSTDEASPSVETPPATTLAAATPTKAPTSAPASSATTSLVAAGVLLLSVAAQLL